MCTNLEVPFYSLFIVANVSTQVIYGSLCIRHVSRSYLSITLSCLEWPIYKYIKSNLMPGFILWFWEWAILQIRHLGINYLSSSIHFYIHSKTNKLLYLYVHTGMYLCNYEGYCHCTWSSDIHSLSNCIGVQAHWNMGLMPFMH